MKCKLRQNRSTSRDDEHLQLELPPSLSQKLTIRQSNYPGNGDAAPSHIQDPAHTKVKALP
jgi:hypothetical protein